MSGDALACSACGYENVVAGCGFCLQCGAEFETPIEEVAQMPEAPQTASPVAAELPNVQAIDADTPSANDVPTRVPSPALEPVVAGVALPSDQGEPPVGSEQEDAIQLSAHPDVVAAPSGGTADYQSAIASAEQIDFETGQWEDHSDAPVEDHTPSQAGMAIADVAPSESTPPESTPLVPQSVPQTQLPELPQSPVPMEQAEQITAVEAPAVPIPGAPIPAAQTAEQAAPEYEAAISPEQLEGGVQAQSAQESQPIGPEHPPTEAHQVNSGPDVPPTTQPIPSDNPSVGSVPMEPAPAELVAEPPPLDSAGPEPNFVEAGPVEAVPVDSPTVEDVPVEDASVEDVSAEAVQAGNTPPAAPDAGAVDDIQLEVMSVDPVPSETAQSADAQPDDVVPVDIGPSEDAEPVVEQPEPGEADTPSQSEAAQPVSDSIDAVPPAATPTGEAAPPELASPDSQPRQDDPPLAAPAELVQSAMEWTGGELPVPQPTAAESFDDGFDLPMESSAAATAASDVNDQGGTGQEADASESDGPLSFSKSLAHELHASIVAAAESADMRLREEDDRLVAQLVIDGRPQVVYIERTYTSDATPVLSFYAVCGPASTQNALPLLEWNRALALCAFAVRDIGDRKMFVIQSNLLAFSVDHLTLRRTLVEIAKRANQVNERLIS